VKSLHPVLFDMTIPKIGDFILLTPSLQLAEKIYPDTAVVVPEPLRDLYARENVFAHQILPEDGEWACEVIDLTYPLLKFEPRRPSRCFDKDLFESPQHVTELYYQALRRFLPALPEGFHAKPFLEIDADEARLATFALKPFTYYTLHTGSDFAPKNWGDRNYEELIGSLAREFPELQAVGLFGPQDRDLFQNGKAPENYRALRTDLLGVADILAGSLFHVDNDSGINHLAGALNTPSISVWGFTGPGTWGALGEQQFTFWGGPACAEHCGGAQARTCTAKICLQSIRPTDLVEAAREILANYNLEL